MDSYIWDNQFYLTPSNQLSEGDTWELSMDVKAYETTENYEGAILFDLQWNNLYDYQGNLNKSMTFTTEWTPIKLTGTVASIPEGKVYQTIAWNLNDYDRANKYYFDNISFKINGVEQIVNGDFEGDDFSSFAYVYNRGDVQQVTEEKVIEVGAEPTEPTPVSISVSTPPYRTTYYVGEDLLLNGIGLTITFSDNSTKTVGQHSIGPDIWYPYDVSGFDNTQTGTQTLTISYNLYPELTTTFEVTVLEGERPREPYAIFTPHNNTLTFYYDVNKFEYSYYATLDDENGMFTAEVYDIPNITTDDYDSRPQWTSGITKVVFDKSFAAYRPTSTARWFDGCSNLQEIEGLQYLNTEEVTNMFWMFFGCRSLTALDVSHFNTVKVTNMGDMFSQCMALTNLDVSNFNTSNVTNMGGMFWACGIEDLDLSSFNTMSVEVMSSMIGFCQNLKTIYVSYDFITPYEGGYIFQNCDNLVGGEGTKWSNDYVVSYAYAHIDGGADNPGLFTKSPKETRTPVSIEIATPPAQLVYAKDEALNLDEKARLTVRFDDGSEIHPRIANSKVTGYDPTVIGEQTVTVEYLGLTTTFEVRVISNGVIVEPDDANTETVADLYDNTLTTVVETETEVDKVVVHREFDEDTPSTIVMPIDMEVGEDMNGYKFYEFGGVTRNSEGKWVATYNQVDHISANKPYIVQNTSSSDDALVFDGGSDQITLKPLAKGETAVSTGTGDNEGWEFVGAYEKKVWETDSPNEFGFAAKDVEADGIKAGDFVRIGAGASLKPMRSYLRYTKDDDPFISKAGVALPHEIEVHLIPLSSVVKPEEPEEPADGDDIKTPVSENVVDDGGVRVWSYDKTIVIAAKPGSEYQIFDANGRLLKSAVTQSDRDEVSLARTGSGIAVVRIGSKTFKVKY